MTTEEEVKGSTAGTPGDPSRSACWGDSLTTRSTGELTSSAGELTPSAGTPAAQRGATHTPPMPREGRPQPTYTASASKKRLTHASPFAGAFRKTLRTVWMLGATMWMLGAMVRMLGAVMWMLGAMLRMLGAMVWMLGAMLVQTFVDAFGSFGRFVRSLDGSAVWSLGSSSDQNG
eukprot:1181017-Prorocentrum_minimum.AAC.2